MDLALDRSTERPRTLDPARLLDDQRWLVALARGLLGGDEHAAEDVAQETRLLAWRHPAGEQERRGGWLARIARNVALRMRARDAARTARERQAAPSERVAAPDELVARVQLQRAVADAVLALAEPYRGVVLLRHFDGLPPRAIAARLAIPVETVRTRLKRAHEQLRARLDAGFGGRDAWALLLVPWLPPGAPVVAASSSGAAGGGWVAMNAGAKVALSATAAGVLGVVGVVAWQASDATDQADPGASRSSHAMAAAALDDDAGRNIPDVERASTNSGRDASSGDDPAARSDVQYEQVHATARLVDEATRGPLAGGEISLRFPTPSNETSVARGTSGADGRVSLRFGPVGVGGYHVSASHPERAFVPDDYRVFSGSVVDGVLEHDLGELALVPGTAVSGVVLRAWDRAPVAGAELSVVSELHFISSGFAANGARPAGTSRPDGTFELPERLPPPRDAATIFAATADGIGWALIKPARGRDRLDGIEIVLESPGALDVAVVDEAGVPIAGADVVAAPRFPPLGASHGGDSMPWIAGRTWRTVFTATTDRAGRATLPCLPEGREQSLLGPFAGHMQSYTIWARADDFGFARRGALVRRGARESVEIVLKTPRESVLRGRVTDARGEPIEGARIELLHHGRTATSGAEGIYRIAPAPLSGRSVEIDVRADGFGPAEFFAWDEDVARRLVPLRDGDGRVTAEELVVDFELARASLLAGSVVDDVGQPVAAVQISATRIDGQSFTRLEPVNGPTGADGVFRFDQAAEGEWEIAVDPPDPWLGPPPRVARPGETGLVIRLQRAPEAKTRLVVELVDAKTGAPLDAAKASVFPTRVRVDRGARTTIERGLVTADGLFAGEWRLRIESSDGRHCSRVLEVTPTDDEVRLRIELDANATLDGRIVLDESVVAKKGERWFVFVAPATNHTDDGGHAVDADGRRIGDLTGSCAYADASGCFRIVDLVPGVPVRLWLAHPTLFAEAIVVLGPGENRLVELHPAPPGEVAWKLAGSLPPGTLEIEVARGNSPFTHLRTSHDGHAGAVVASDRFATGTIRWRAEFVRADRSVPELRVAEGEVMVTAGERTIVEVSGFD